MKLNPELNPPIGFNLLNWMTLESKKCIHYELIAITLITIVKLANMLTTQIQQIAPNEVHWVVNNIIIMLTH